MRPILFMNQCSGVGGVERILEAYAAAWGTQPDPERAYAWTPFDGDAAHTRAMTKGGFSLLPLRDRTPVAQRPSSPPLTRKKGPFWLTTWKRLAPARIDLLNHQLRKTRRLNTAWACRLKDLSPEPGIVHMHTGYYDWLAGGMRAVQSTFPSARIVIHLHNPPAFFRPTCLERRALRSADAVIFVSRQTQDVWEHAVGPLPRAIVLPSPIHWHEAVEPPVPNAGHFTIGLIGRLSPVKGMDIALRAMALLRAKHPEAKLQIAGQGPEDQRLRTLARELHLEHAVQFLGFVEDPVSLYCKLDCLIQPSESEGMPITLLEAMGYGLPVVATPVGGVPEVVRTDHNGLLIPPRDPAALAQALETLIEHTELRQRLGSEARKVRARHEARAALTELFSLYERVLGS